MARKRPARARTAKASPKTSSKPAAKKKASDQSGKLYYRIGEVSELTGVKPYVLRYWESEFRWMAPQKSRSQQRLYRPKDIDTILLIKKLLYEDRYTIAGARQKLRELGVGARQEAAAGARKKAQRTRYDAPAEVAALRDELLALREALAPTS